MGFMDKLMFWKKHDDLSDLGLRGNDLGSPDLGADPVFGHDAIGRNDFGFGLEQRPMQQQFQQPYNYPQPPPIVPQPPFQQERSRDNSEIISSKLDVLKAKLDSIDQRLSNIERIAQGEQEERRRKTW